jgi:hypothetical protein
MKFQNRDRNFISFFFLVTFVASLSACNQGTKYINEWPQKNYPAPSPSPTPSQTPPLPECKTLSLKTGEITPDPAVTAKSLYTTENFTVSCDYGIFSDSIRVSAPGGNCQMSGFVGTALQFSCKAPSVGGSLTVACEIIAGNSANLCAKNDLLESLNIVSITGVEAKVTSLSGPITSRSFGVELIPNANDVGKSGAIYIAAVVKDASGNKMFYQNPDLSFTLDEPGKTPPAFKAGTIPASFSAVVQQGAELSPYVGTDVYIGYGLGSNPSAEMLSTTRYMRFYTVK